MVKSVNRRGKFMDEITRQEWRTKKDIQRNTLMTQEELRRVDDYICELNENVGTMYNFHSSWAEIEEAYCNDTAKKENLPNTRMNIMIAAIEGMITQLVDTNISVATKGQGPEDAQFADDARIGLNWAIEHNQMVHKLSLHSRRRLKFGTGIFKVIFDHNEFGGYGLAKIQVPPLNKVFIDSNITDSFRLQEARYIAETINCDYNYAKEVYGKDKASIIDYGPNQYRDNGIFTEEPDDEYSWVLIQYWTRRNGVLRLQEFTGCGLLLFDSFKGKDRKENQKDNEVTEHSYYKYVYDKYPYFITTKYTIEGKLHGFGDGKLLLPLLNMMNELYDKIRIQMRPNLLLVDIHSDINLAACDDNSFEPLTFDGAKTQGRQPVYNVPWGNISSEMYSLIAEILQQSQKIVRFSDLMLGMQSSNADTATQAAIQQQQGNSHIAHEKAILEETLSEVCKYMLGLMIEFTQGGKSMRVGMDEDAGSANEFSWVDFNKMADVPVQIPASKAYRDQWKEKHKKKKLPKYEILEENGSPVTKSVEMDISISIGSGLPKNPAFLWSMVEKLSQLMVIDTEAENGQMMPKPAINWKELREFMKNYLGIPIKTDDQMTKFIEEFKKAQAANTAATQQAQPMPNTQGQAAEQLSQQPNPDAAGLTAAGGVQAPQQPGPMGAGQGAY
jgi:hypothetical protein